MFSELVMRKTEHSFLYHWLRMHEVTGCLHRRFTTYLKLFDTFDMTYITRKKLASLKVLIFHLLTASSSYFLIFILMMIWVDKFQDFILKGKYFI